ncbi:cytochrome c oxidase cbb3-type subunit 4 [Novosphingobium kunmingense]|uniref:Cytochrome c oxidase cbb3-type subunit 4 n=1 Tax=Novosphingobium kunmingense TaxID=1211806 RepID=A0A2N0I2V9_9SPHN|nr:cbb3-type cytochrome c oxidase subunit 3 [Novosphingobium kunmingense]PKB25513.1 cytochrome c oxidase cbb3-type subunit 4 [Novosphingobium kunmingense]
MSDYESLRHFADSIGLAVMVVLFLGLCLWPFLPGKKATNQRMAQSIFEGDDDGE